ERPSQRSETQAVNVGVAPLPSSQEIAEFWTMVFAGPSPFGVPPINGLRTNERVLNNCTVWDVTFDSYKDPGTDLPVRLGGVFAVSNEVPPPGPGGTFPGLVVTHSVGEGPPNGPAADDVEGMSTWFAQKGFATLAFYMRGWGTSPMSTDVDLFTDFLADEDGEPLDHRFTGMAVDAYQAGEFMGAQPEVWDANDLVYVGHSGGGYAVLAAGVFSSRFKTLCASAPAGAWPSSTDWLNYVWGNGGFLSIQNWVNSQPDPAYAQSLVERTLTFISLYHVIDNPFLVSANSNWRLDDASIFFYGGQADTAIPPWDVAAVFQIANPSAPLLKAFHWSPTGGHGGSESWNRTQAWVAGHYPGITSTPPNAVLGTTSINGASASFSSSGSQVWQYDWAYDNGQMSSDPDDIVSWEYDFGDGTVMNWGPTVSHSYSQAGTYTVIMTITDGAGQRASDSVEVTVDQGSGSNAQLEVVAEQPEIITEGSTNSFLVRLTEHPEGSVNVTIDHIAGDSDLSVASGFTLVFTPGNWDDFQSVSLAAAQDTDRSSDFATFSLSSPGMLSVDVEAMERDDDAEFTLTVGSALAELGESVSLPITLTNHDNAPIAAFSIDVAFDGSVLTNPSATPGPDLPGPAWWQFATGNPSEGVQTIVANEFVQPEAPVFAGVIVEDGFTIAGGADAGNYPVLVTEASVNGATPALEAGGVTVGAGAAVPAVSRWGLVIMMLLVTTVGTILRFGRFWWKKSPGR
ncbi:MAG: PKD domain-containing protein, partial [Phycisphaerae bacterium]